MTLYTDRLCVCCGWDCRRGCNVQRSEPCSKTGRQARAAMHSRQDKDWAGWTPKQRQKARLNGEYYGEERFWVKF